MKIKNILIIGLFIGILGQGIAQDQPEEISLKRYSSGFKLGLNGNLILPFGITSNMYSSGIGGGVSGKYVIDGTIGIGAFLNYNALVAKVNYIGVTNTVMSYGGSIDYYFPSTKVIPLIGLDIGYYKFSTNYASGINGGIGYTADNSIYSGLGFGPNIGVIYTFSNSINGTVNFKYNHILASGFTTQLVTISLGLIIGFGSN